MQPAFYRRLPLLTNLGSKQQRHRGGQTIARSGIQLHAIGMRRSLLPEAVERYVTSQVTVETPLQKRLREETSRLKQGAMQISADQGALLALIVRMIGARRALEIGTFTGYSALSVASTLPNDGKLICCDVSEEWTGIARRYWAEAGVSNRIDLRLAPAIETLDGLLADGHVGT